MSDIHRTCSSRTCKTPQTPLSVDYKFKTCEDCRKSDTEAAKKRKEEARQKAAATINAAIEKYCEKCKKIKPLDQFTTDKNGGKTSTAHCQSCRDKQQIQDHKRDKDHINELARVNSQKPERKEKKLEYREQHQDQVVSAWLNYRARQLTENAEEYRARCAKQQQERRNKMTQEERDAFNVICRADVEYNYNRNKYNALKFEPPWTLTLEKYSALAMLNCFYCGGMNEKGINGIDALDVRLGHTAENCVTACSLCNYMKACLTPRIFIQRVEHILTSRSVIVGGNLYPNSYTDSGNASFADYATRAQNKGLIFDISCEMYKAICTRNCYICDKASTPTHVNGIDRIDNTNGYIIDNVAACCSHCNYMKKDKSIEEFMQHLVDIYNHQQTQKDDLRLNVETEITSSIFKTRKSKEEVEKYLQEKRDAKAATMLAKQSPEAVAERAKTILNRRKEKENK